MTTHTMTLDHLTLNTGNRRASPRSEVRSHILPTLLEAARHGAIPFPCGMYRCLFVRTGLPGFASVTLLDAVGYRPHITMHICWDAARSAAAWQAVEATVAATDAQDPSHPLILRGGPGHAPVTVPWLAVLIWPTVDAALVEYLGDFERCLAWALIEEDQRARDLLN